LRREGMSWSFHVMEEGFSWISLAWWGGKEGRQAEV